MNIQTCLAGSAVAALLLTAAARAGESTYLRSTVTYADLDLSTPAGDAALYRRVQKAASRVCGDFDGFDLFGRFVVGPTRAACEADVLQQAVHQIHVRAFTDYVMRQNEVLALAVP